MFETINRKAFLIPLIALVLCFCVFCSIKEPLEPVAVPQTHSKAIDHTGDTISLGPVTVWIPSGAVDPDSAVTFTITEIWSLPIFPANLAKSGYGYAIEPHGFTFNELITIEVEYDTMLVGPALMRLDSLGDDSWEQLGATVFDLGLATFETNQLSVFSLAKFNALTTVYVANSSRGDYAAGTSRDPLPTIVQGINASLDAGEPYPEVRVAVGTYAESPNLRAGVSMVGGLDSLSWNPVQDAYSVIECPGYSSVYGESITVETQITAFHIISPDQVDPARSAIPLKLAYCSNALQFTSCFFQAGRGQDGIDGSNGSTGPSGDRGSSAGGVTGASGGGGICVGGRGGNGVLAPSCATAQSGYRGGCLGGAGGSGGSISSGGNGGNGSAGAAGGNGSGTGTLGRNYDYGWYPDYGGQGANGGPGT
ncbi:MAG: hypothetical protein JSU65_12560, partial [Candidatus Zixiibacteriota bacterium]